VRATAKRATALGQWEWLTIRRMQQRRADFISDYIVPMQFGLGETLPQNAEAPLPDEGVAKGRFRISVVGEGLAPGESPQICMFFSIVR
jgi:hypothetical protein